MKKSFDVTFIYEDGSEEVVTTRQFDDGWKSYADPAKNAKPVDPEIRFSERKGKIMKNYKVYGNEPTALHLTEKAYETYASIDPLEIREYTDEDNNHTYDIIGAVDFHNLTAYEVRETLEDLGRLAVKAEF